VEVRKQQKYALAIQQKKDRRRSIHMKSFVQDLAGNFEKDEKADKQ